jgi:hypothetical protein
LVLFRPACRARQITQCPTLESAAFWITYDGTITGD